MSIQAVAWVLTHSRSRGIDRLVLISIANHADAELVAWPSMRTIADEAGVAAGTVSHATRRLVEIGELEIIDRGDSRRSTTYRLVQEMNARQRSPDERTARPRGERSARPRARQNHHEPSLTLSEGCDAPETIEPNPQTLVAGWVDVWRQRHRGRDPDRSWRAACGRAVKAQLTEGRDPDELARVLAVMADRNKHPSQLAHVLADLDSGALTIARPAPAPALEQTNGNAYRGWRENVEPSEVAPVEGRLDDCREALRR
jgi:hypothetical protein